jgi:hypothetical protein
MDLGETVLGGVDWMVWLRIGTSWWFLWIRWWTFGFDKMLGNYWVAPQLVASRVVLSSIELVSSLVAKSLYRLSYPGCKLKMFFNSRVYCKV